MKCRSRWLPLGIAILGFSGCSPDFIPVHYSRVNSAKTAKLPLKLEPGAPGSFSRAWTFEKPAGFRFDPSEIEFTSGVARLPARARQPAFLETSFGAPFAALYEFTETAGTGPAVNTGKRIRYQISGDRTHWYFYDHSRWQVASPVVGQTSSAAEIQEGLRHFHAEVGSGQLFVRVFLLPGEVANQARTGLQRLEVRGIAPKTDGWN